MAENSISKARYWWAVLYQENMVDGWREKIEDELQIPFAYCEHTLDTDAKSEHRKDHMHLILAFPNTTTYSHALNVFKLLGDDAVNTCKAVVNIRNAYDYLIHDTNACRKAGKHLYSPEQRICGNNFDIGSYEQISMEEKQGMLREMVSFIKENRCMDLMTFTDAALDYFGLEYWDIIVGYNAVLERYCRSMYQRWERGQKSPSQAPCCSSTTQHHGICCPECGSIDVKKRGKTPSDRQRYECKDCGKTFV